MAKCGFLFLTQFLITSIGSTASSIDKRNPEPHCRVEGEKLDTTENSTYL